MEILNTLGIDWKLLIAQIVNFSVLLGLLTYFLYKPLLRIIDQRRERVRQSLDNAAHIEKQLADMEKTRKKQLKEMDEQTKVILAEARAQATKTKAKLLADTKVDVEEMLEKGRKQMEAERQKLLTDLQKTVTSISIGLAEKVIEREFTDADQKRLLKVIEKDIPTLIQ